MGMLVPPEPVSVPPFQLKAEEMVIGWEPLSVPARVRVETVTVTSRVTVWLTIAVSPAPGTPAPPQVAALLQLPLWELVKLAACRETAVAKNQKHSATRGAILLMSRLPGTLSDGGLVMLAPISLRP